jgi:hypothetical protein
VSLRNFAVSFDHSWLYLFFRTKRSTSSQVGQRETASKLI